MKGAIAVCLTELVTQKFGSEKWKQVLKKSKLPENTTFLPHQNLADAQVLTLFQNACSVLGLSAAAGAEAFGEHWCCTFAPRIYGAYYNGAKNAKEFLLRMKDVHDMVTRTIPDARPPLFSYEQPSPHKLVMKYSSKRGLTEIFVGLVKGVGRHFHENLRIDRVASDTVAITFPY